VGEDGNVEGVGVGVKREKVFFGVGREASSLRGMLLWKSFPSRKEVKALWAGW